MSNETVEIKNIVDLNKAPKIIKDFYKIWLDLKSIHPTVPMAFSALTHSDGDIFVSISFDCKETDQVAYKNIEEYLYHYENVYNEKLKKKKASAEFYVCQHDKIDEFVMMDDKLPDVILDTQNIDKDYLEQNFLVAEKPYTHIDVDASIMFTRNEIPYLITTDRKSFKFLINSQYGFGTPQNNVVKYIYKKDFKSDVELLFWFARIAVLVRRYTGNNDVPSWFKINYGTAKKIKGEPLSNLLKMQPDLETKDIGTIDIITALLVDVSKYSKEQPEVIAKLKEIYPYFFKMEYTDFNSQLTEYVTTNHNVNKDSTYEAYHLLKEIYFQED